MYKLTEVQKDAIFAMECNYPDGLLICMEMGCGKTAVALMWLIKRFRENRISDALVVCPASLVPNWEASIDKMIMFEGVGPQDVMNLQKKVKIVSFQKTYKVDRKRIQHKNGTESVSRVLSLRDDVDKHWGAVIVDEVHCVGAHNSMQGKAVRTLAKLTKCRYGLTGTPTSGGGGDSGYHKLYGELEFIQPGIFGTWTKFCDQLVLSYDRFYNPSSYDVPKCQRLLEDHAIVARLEDCYDMPGTTETDIPCPLAASKPYNDMRRGATIEYNVTIKVAGGQYSRMLQVCSGSLKDDDGKVMSYKCSKDAALIDILNGTDDAVVIFCNYRASVDRVATTAKKAGRKVLTFDGRTPKKGTPPWMAFQKGEADVLVCQYQSGGVGLDLYRSHISVLYEPCYSALLLAQALARTYRKGQKHRCLYYYLITPKTVEARAWRTVRSGKDITEKMMTEWAEKGFDL